MARAITLIESSNEAHRLQARLMLEYVLQQRKVETSHSLDSAVPRLVPPVSLAQSLFRVYNRFTSHLLLFHVKMRLGIAGPPGAGKSSLIERLGRRLTSLGHKVAVLTIDPSSHVTGGSILGDKVIFNQLKS